MKYCKQTVPPLLYDLANRNPGYHVVFVLGGNSEFRIEKTLNTTFISTPVNSFDFTGLITLVENPEIITTEYIFYMHDTVAFGPDFFTILAKVDLDPKPPAICFRCPSANMGLYSMSYLLEPTQTTTLLQLRNTDSSPEKLQALKHMMVVIEDLIFKLHPTRIFMFPTAPSPQWGKEVFPYGTDTPRMKEIYEDLDFWKYKATWSPAKTYNLQP